MICLRGAMEGGWKRNRIGIETGWRLSDTANGVKAKGVKDRPATVLRWRLSLPVFSAAMVSQTGNPR
jgi:hypothetical protein